MINQDRPPEHMNEEQLGQKILNIIITTTSKESNFFLRTTTCAKVVAVAQPGH